MRAYVLKRYGGAQAAEMADVAAPEPGPRDILVRVRAAGLNPVDFKFRQGKLRAIYRPRLPFVMGAELSGEVIAVGREVARFAPGDRVFARTAKNVGGAFAERACVDEAHAALMPPELDFEPAAATPLAGLTALQALRDELRVGRGQKVLITGGAGGVGTFAIQIAARLGAEVTTTASPRGAALVRSLGCDAVIDYTVHDLSAIEERFDAGLDLIGGPTLDAMFAVMKRGARVVSVAGLPEPRTATQDLGRGRALAALFWLASRAIRAKARRAGVDYRYLFMHPSGDELAELGALFARGALRIVIDRVFPFERLPEAMACLEGGRAKGKIVVSMTPTPRPAPAA